MRTRVEVRQFYERKPRTKSPYGVHFMMLSQRGVTELSERLDDRTITIVGVRVLVAMLRHMDFENRVDVSQKDLAAELGLAQTHLAKACRTLMECGFIERMANRRGWYRISPRLCWKGSVKNLETELARQAA